MAVDVERHGPYRVPARSIDWLDALLGDSHSVRRFDCGRMPAEGESCSCGVATCTVRWSAYRSEDFIIIDYSKKVIV